MTLLSLSTRRRRFTFVHPSDLRLIRFAPPGSGIPLDFSGGFAQIVTDSLHAPDGDGIEHYLGFVLRTTSLMRPRVALIESSVAPRARRGLALWRNQGAEIRPKPAGGLSVPSCSQPGRSYRVSIVGEGRCSCADWRRRRKPCKHVFAALIWAAKERRQRERRVA